MVDLIGDHFCSSLTNSGKHVAIGHCTQALIPRIVARREVSCHIVVGAQFLAHLIKEKASQAFWSSPREPIQVNLEKDFFPTGQAKRPANGQEFSQ